MESGRKRLNGAVGVVEEEGWKGVRRVCAR